MVFARSLCKVLVFESVREARATLYGLQERRGLCLPRILTKERAYIHEEVKEISSEMDRGNFIKHNCLGIYIYDSAGNESLRSEQRDE